jgi:hypothetical protein
MSVRNLRRQGKTSKGITLIALVITIIVLIILAAVSIATLTGENGILSKANTAKTETEKAGAKEKVQMAVMSSFDNSGKLDYGQLKTNLDKVEGISVPPAITNLPITVKVDGYDVKIDENGKVIVTGENGGSEDTPTPTLPTVEEVKETGTVLDENNPTTITDTYGNEVKVPEGFKIAEDSAINVTGGVVIEDVSHGATAGSQFVWIPVGTVYTSVDKSTSKTITLGRYSFANDGTPSQYSGDYKEENSQETESLLNYGNTIAKDIEVFKTSATTNKGYYIGRYEARSVAQRTAKTDALAQVTVRPNDYVYNYVTQPQAATLARNMYKEDKKFTSDLINSYAWDTAIVFLQNFDNRVDKTKPYSRQNSLNTGSVALQGTNHLTDLAKQDKICNIWDMASNDWEWTTETNSDSSSPCAGRGGLYDSSSSNYTSDRSYTSTSYAYDSIAFRSALYL